MKISVGADHAGYALKLKILDLLKKRGCTVVDLGTHSPDSCDYPGYAEAVGKSVASGETDLGVLACGTGIGMLIVANKIPGVRAALCYNQKVAVETRQHNDSNVIVLPGREFPVEENLKILEAWLGTSFTNEERHARRVRMIREIEKKWLR